jgi:AraC-like DNA-binding protein/mannose-6-phosphate isomerase-like protein (cupin superfamily)
MAHMPNNPRLPSAAHGSPAGLEVLPGGMSRLLETSVDLRTAGTPAVTRRFISPLIFQESVPLDEGSAFRLLRWSRSLAHVQIVNGPGQCEEMAGQGDHWHFHRAMELTLVLRGEGTRFVGDHIELFEPGDLVLIGSQVPHYWHMRGPSQGLALQWDFPPEHGIWTFPETSGLRRLEEVALRGLHVRGPTAVILQRQMERVSMTTGLTRFAVFMDILAGLVAAPARDLRQLSQRSFPLAGKVDHQHAMRRAVSYILAHYREPIELSQLQHLVSMSRATFIRQFRAHTGKSFSTFVNQVRLQAVCRCLRETCEPIGNVAFAHGFSTLSFFNRLFRREFGVSPSMYRNGVARVV